MSADDFDELVRGVYRICNATPEHVAIPYITKMLGRALSKEFNEMREDYFRQRVNGHAEATK